MSVPRALLFAALGGALVAGCGSSDEKSKDPVAAVQSSVRDQVRSAQSVDPATFPKPEGTSLEQFASQFDAQGPQAVAASSVFTPKKARLAFGLLDDNLHFVYGKTVVYLQPRGGGKILGPFAAPADVLITEPKYRSRQAASEKDPFAAIYAADVPITKPGIWNALAVSEGKGGNRVGALMSFQAMPKGRDKVPEVGQKAPPVQTDTTASLKGNTDLLDTRIPPALDLTRTSFADVVGKKPVA